MIRDILSIFDRLIQAELIGLAVIILAIVAAMMISIWIKREKVRRNPNPKEFTDIIDEARKSYSQDPNGNRRPGEEL